MPGGGHVNAEEIIPLLRSLTDAGMSETQARIVAEQQAMFINAVTRKT